MRRSRGTGWRCRRGETGRPADSPQRRNVSQKVTPGIALRVAAQTQQTRFSTCCGVMALPAELTVTLLQHRKRCLPWMFRRDGIFGRIERDTGYKTPRWRSAGEPSPFVLTFYPGRGDEAGKGGEGGARAGSSSGMAPGKVPGAGEKGGEKGGMRKSLPRMALRQFHHLFRLSPADRAEMSGVLRAPTPPTLHFFICDRK